MDRRQSTSCRIPAFWRGLWEEGLWYVGHGHYWKGVLNWNFVSKIWRIWPAVVLHTTFAACTSDLMTILIDNAKYTHVLHRCRKSGHEKNNQSSNPQHHVDSPWSFFQAYYLTRNMFLMPPIQGKWFWRRGGKKKGYVREKTGIRLDRRVSFWSI